MTNHAIQRAKERYNLDLDFSDILKIIKMITSNQSIPCGQKDSNKSIHLVQYKDTTLKVVYQKGYKSKYKQKIVTFLPLI